MSIKQVDSVEKTLYKAFQKNLTRENDVSKMYEKNCGNHIIGMDNK